MPLGKRRPSVPRSMGTCLVYRPLLDSHKSGTPLVAYLESRSMTLYPYLHGPHIQTSWSNSLLYMEKGRLRDIRCLGPRPHSQSNSEPGLERYPPILHLLLPRPPLHCLYQVRKQTFLHVNIGYFSSETYFLSCILSSPSIPLYFYPAKDRLGSPGL